MPSATTITFALAFALCALPASAQTSPHEIEAKKIFSDLIAFRSSEGHDQVRPMAEYIVGRLREAGVPTDDLAEIPMGEAHGLIVRVAGADERLKPILFSSHMDVVDARPEDWQRDPFKLVEEDGFYFGRGATDNKAGVTAMLSTILRLKASSTMPARSLLFAFVGDEETEMKTTQAIAAHPWVKNAEFAINTDAGVGVIGEDGTPLVYQVQGAEKTYATFEITATNSGGHSSKPRSDNAIFDLADAVTKLRHYRFPVMSNALTRSYLAAAGKLTGGPTGKALLRFAADPSDEQAAAVLEADPEYVGTIRTTCVPTRLEAGHADNALPQRAKVTVNCRIFPGVSKDEVQRRLESVVGNSKLSVRLSDGTPESPASEMRPDVMQAIMRWVNRYYPGVPVVPYMESGATDGLYYRAAGIPTFATSGIFRKSSDNFEHGLNERIPVRSFYESLDHIFSLATELGRLRQ
jgi:carboxypeptidase PM20D1